MLQRRSQAAVCKGLLLRQGAAFVIAAAVSEFPTFAAVASVVVVVVVVVVAVVVAVVAAASSVAAEGA